MKEKRSKKQTKSLVDQLLGGFSPAILVYIMREATVSRNRQVKIDCLLTISIAILLILQIINFLN